MKKTLIFILLFSGLFLFGCEKKTKFDTTDMTVIADTPDYILDYRMTRKTYLSIDGYFPKGGLVPTPKIAFQIAEVVLSNFYGKENIAKQKPFNINLEDDIWIIEGTLYSRKGGVSYMEIKKSNGEILKVIHTK